MKKEDIFQDTNHLNVNPPEWTNTLREDAIKLLKQNSTGGLLKAVQYDINPENQALECYHVTLNNGTQTSAYIAYQKINDKPSFTLTIHLTNQNFNNE